MARAIGTAILFALLLLTGAPASAQYNDNFPPPGHHWAGERPLFKPAAVKAKKKVAAKRKAARPVAATRIAPGTAHALIAKARAYLGKTAAQLGLPARQWCSDFMNKITGGGTGSRLARSWMGAGVAAAGPAPGVVAVMSRGKRGGHVGIVSDANVCGRGRVMMISGNSAGRRVYEGCVSTRNVIAWRWV